RHNLSWVGKRQQGVAQIRHEPDLFFRVLSFGNISRCADGLPDRTVFIPREDLVAAVKPTPGAAAVAHPVFKLCCFTMRQVCQSAKVVEEGVPVVGVHHRADELPLFQILLLAIAESGRDATTDEDTSPVTNIKDIDYAGRCLDDVFVESSTSEV